MKNSYTKKGLFITTLIFVAGFAPSIAQAVNYTVTVTNDELDGSPSCITGSATDCSLREAVQLANANTSGNHTITLGTGTHTLSLTGSGENLNATGDLDITNTTNTITIQGNSAATTIIDANDIDRIFDLTNSSTALILEDVTIQDGTVTDGGAIYVNGNLTVNSSVIQNNVATTSGGGIYVNQGTVTIDQTTFSGNTASTSVGEGGAMLILASSGVTIENSTFSSNSASGGGAISSPVSNANDLTITNSTFNGNMATGDGGGLYVTGTNDTDLIHTTFSENIADSDDDDNGNGGAFYDNTDGVGDFIVKHSIFADNSDENGSQENCAFTTGQSIASSQYNVDAGTSCNFAGTGDVEGIDPEIGSLTSNGGATSTQALGDAGFPNVAVNIIPPAACVAVLGVSPTDQRGEPRTGYCDAGAYEYQDSTAPVITRTGSASVTHACGSAYTDAGATATDNVDGTLTSSIETNSTVDDDAIGTYSVTYDVADLSLNDATQVSRSVEVTDTVDPTVTLTGNASITLTAGLDTYTEQGATATDACDGSLTATPSGSVDDDVAGVYIVTYTATDASGNVGTATRTVTVQAQSVGGNDDDTDTDGDGIPDSEDDDIDGDGTPNNEDTDIDGDGTPNDEDGDIDGDGIPNERDIDSDNDGVVDNPVSATTNGKVVRVFIGDTKVAQAKISKKKIAKKFRKVRVKKLYPNKSYFTVAAIIAPTKNQARLTVFRFTANQTLKKKVSRSFDIPSRKKISLKMKQAKKRIVVNVGGEKRVWKLTKKGKLKAVQ